MNTLEKIVLGGATVAILGIGIVSALKRDEHETRTEPTPISVAAPIYTQEPTITPKPTPEPTLTTGHTPGLENILTEQQIVEYVAGWQAMQPITPELLNKVDMVNKSIFYHFFGTTFEAERFVTKLLTDEEYESAASKPYGPSLGSVGGAAVLPDGTINIYAHSYIDYERVSPLAILETLAHETGQAHAQRNWMKISKFVNVPANPKLYLEEIAEKYNLGDVSDISDMKSDMKWGWVERESLQALYRIAVFHKLEELGAYKNPTIGRTSKEMIDETVDRIVNSKSYYVQAHLVDWYRALNHPDTLASLQKDGKITSQQALSLLKEYLKKEETNEGQEQLLAEIITAIKTGPQYARQIKEAMYINKRGDPVP